jgi:predicted RNA binding protein YcfA (HicA-like mRNA interferase family)
MSKREKLRSKLRNNPKDAARQDVETLLLRFGFTLARIRGSHHIFDFDDGERFKQIIIPFHRNIVKSTYVEKILDAIDELFPEEDTDSKEQEDE